MKIISELELTLDQALQKGVEAHKAGKVQEADRYYTAILKANPKHPDANHNMGVLAVGVGKVEEALPFFKTALEVNQTVDQFWLSYVDALIKLDRMDDAKAVLEHAKSKSAKGDSFHQLEKRLAFFEYEQPNIQDPPIETLKGLVNLYSKGQFQKALTQASQLLKKFPNSINLLNITGAINKRLSKLDDAIIAYTKAVYLKPDYADAYYNMGNALNDQGKLKDSIEAYKTALSIKPDYAEAHNNMGLALQDIDNLDDAIRAFKKSIIVKPDYADAYYNMGNALNDQGKLKDSIEAYKTALSIKPDYAEAYNNMGNALQELGKLKAALKSFNKALSLEPDNTNAHRNLSLMKKYKENDDQIVQVKNLYSRKNLSEDARCNLSFTLAKIYEDIGDIEKSFEFFTKGNALRKKLLSYSIDQDKDLFIKLKKTQPLLSKNSLKVEHGSSGFSPIFIVGMPRSGTTLLEQIISSHSQVNGAGELKYIAQFGLKLSTDSMCINTTDMSKFRQQYLSELSKTSSGKRFVTDKMPQNFRFIPLICAAFPEAKIVHVKRDPAATCWSNFKHYFVTKNLGYCYDLQDVVEYYNLYNHLMTIWQSEYDDRIYNLYYENLTIDQEKETRELIKYLNLDWEEACLSPHDNKRSVRTASEQQVRKKVYKGSSNAWRKYEPYLNGAFDSLLSL